MAATTASPGVHVDALAGAHARLLHDPSYQFSFAPPPPAPAPAPEWLMGLVRFLSLAGPYLQWVFWGILVAGVAAILVLLIREFLLYRRPTKAAPAILGEAGWRPSAARARALLADADKLAAEGRFEEAAHVLLFRSIDDIEEKRPRLVCPAYTSRDIAVLGDLPEPASRALNVIVRHVERSLFGGRSLTADDFDACRIAYQTFAFADQWSGR